MTENGREQLIQVPGSKSIANRALICAALANSSSTITNCAPGDDTQAMFEALKILGVATVQDGTTVRVNSQINLEDTQIEGDVHAAYVIADKMIQERILRQGGGTNGV